MISFEGFSKGDTVQFQDHNLMWRNGTVMYVDFAEYKIKGPDSVLMEQRPTQVHVRFFDTAARADRVIILPKKRVRAIGPSV